MLTDHGIQHQRDIRNIARHGAVDIQHAEGERAWSMRNPAGARPQSDDRTERRRQTDGAGHVAAGRKPSLAARDRGRRTSGRSARGKPGVPGVAGVTEYFVDGGAAGAELRRIGFGNDDRAVGFEPLDQDVGA